jgi:hypothetical protein
MSGYTIDGSRKWDQLFRRDNPPEPSTQGWIIFFTELPGLSLQMQP